MCGFKSSLLNPYFVRKVNHLFLKYQKIAVNSLLQSELGIYLRSKMLNINK